MKLRSSFFSPSSLPNSLWLNRFKSMGNRNRLAKLLVGSLLAGALSVIGCGDSREDLFQKAAMRPRGNPDEEVEEPKAAPPPQKEAVAAVAKPTKPANPQPVPEEPEDTEAESAGELSLAEELGMTPISERKSDTLSENAARKKAVDNLMKVFEALETYREKNNGVLPMACHYNAGGIPSISWRVTILPYLGYEKLYSKFDFDKPWNRGINKKLLEFIPEEYATLGDTRTNIMALVGEGCFLNNNTRSNPERAPDGIHNVLMLLECNDAVAPNWSEPRDFDPQKDQIEQFVLVSSRTGSLPFGEAVCRR